MINISALLSTIVKKNDSKKYSWDRRAEKSYKRLLNGKVEKIKSNETKNND